MSDLNEDLLSAVFQFFPPQQCLAQLTRVCSSWNNAIISNEETWRVFTQKQFKIDPKLIQDVLIMQKEGSDKTEQSKKFIYESTEFDTTSASNSTASTHPISHSFSDLHSIKRRKIHSSDSHTRNSPSTSNYWLSTYHRMSQFRHLHCIQSFKQHTDEVLNCCFNHAGTLLVTSAKDGQVRVYTVNVNNLPAVRQTKELVVKLRHVFELGYGLVGSKVSFCSSDEFLLVHCQTSDQNQGCIVVYDMINFHLIFCRNSDPCDTLSCWYPSGSYFTSMSIPHRVLLIDSWHIQSVAHQSTSNSNTTDSTQSTMYTSALPTNPRSLCLLLNQRQFVSLYQARSFINFINIAHRRKPKLLREEEYSISDGQLYRDFYNSKNSKSSSNNNNGVSEIETDIHGNRPDVTEYLSSMTAEDSELSRNLHAQKQVKNFHPVLPSKHPNYECSEAELWFIYQSGVQQDELCIRRMNQPIEPQYDQTHFTQNNSSAAVTAASSPERHNMNCSKPYVEANAETEVTLATIIPTASITSTPATTTNNNTVNASLPQLVHSLTPAEIMFPYMTAMQELSSEDELSDEVEYDDDQAAVEGDVDVQEQISGEENESEVDSSIDGSGEVEDPLFDSISELSPSLDQMKAAIEDSEAKKATDLVVKVNGNIISTAVSSCESLFVVQLRPFIGYETKSEYNHDSNSVELEYTSRINVGSELEMKVDPFVDEQDDYPFLQPVSSHIELHLFSMNPFVRLRTFRNHRAKTSESTPFWIWTAVSQSYQSNNRESGNSRNSSNSSSCIESSMSWCNNRYIVSGDELGKMFVWDLSYGCELVMVDAHVNVLNAVQFHPSTRAEHFLMATVSDDHELKLWALADALHCVE